MLQHGKTLYYWKGTVLEEGLRDGTEGSAAQKLYLTNSKGISSNEELLEAMRNDKGIILNSKIWLHFDVLNNKCI